MGVWERDDLLEKTFRPERPQDTIALGGGGGEGRLPLVRE
jgi:hypothetical protein